MPSRTPKTLLLSALALLAAASPAHAEPNLGPDAPSVVRVDAHRVYLRIGAGQGATAGAAIVVYEPVDITTPSGAAETHYFPVAELALTEVGPTLSYADVAPEIAGRVKVGYAVELVADARTTPVAPTPRAPAVTPTSAPPRPRPRPPTSPPEDAQSPSRDRRSRVNALGFLHVRPDAVTRGQTLGVAAYAPPPLGTPRVHFRPHGDISYASAAMLREANDHYTYVIPREVVGRGDTVEYYLTVEDPDGAEVIAYANPERPDAVTVRSDVFDANAQLSRYRGNRHRLAIFSEVVSYGGDELYVHSEADYFYRVFTKLYRLRMGLGHFNGQGYRELDGGDIDPATQDTVGVAWYYGHAEFEWRFHTYFSVLTKFMLGINNDGVGFGGELVARVGDELGLNLEIGVVRAGDLGTSGMFRLNVPAGEDFIVSGSAWVENLPLDEEAGFRMALDGQWFVSDHWALTARVGLAARTVDRIGPNVGLGVAGHF